MKTITVPYYDSLSVEHILENFGSREDVLKYLCDERDLPKFPRAYLCNLINAIVGPEFRNWVQKRINDRNEILAEEKGNNIEFDPEIEKALNKSTYVSSKSITILSQCH